MLDDEFLLLNRTALVLRPQQPFIDWLQHHDPGTRIDEENLEGDVYLLPDFETRAGVMDWLQENFDKLFTEQLNNWYVDDRMWPDNRSWDLFRSWFSFSIHTMIFDTQMGEIEKG